MFEAFPIHHSKEAAHDVSVEERANWQRAARRKDKASATSKSRSSKDPCSTSSPP
jgi:hypothetical protein